ncbi:AraC family transcriptional regulator [Paractinoplanes globisporus]|uniref:Helix-turn-helix domain-containing protein n=1 Tax=Paractinoplanes globisporus TaxID=113565 RepID=A0ABW6WGA9_9ACTN|nr:AraC family transcriptional regulator [Actinoplanes globisporus]
MTGTTIEHTDTLVHFGDDSFVYAGHHYHPTGHPVHTHSFIEVAIGYAGDGVHRSLAGRQPMRPGDVVLLRPGVWHGYEDCHDLDLYNCCFSAGLLRQELAWTRDDPLLGELLWTGPYATGGRGMLTTRLAPDDFAECVEHLDALSKLRLLPPELHRGDLIARLTLVLGCLARTLPGAGQSRPEPAHPAVAEAIRWMEERPAHPWTLTELATALHLAPGYLVRLFKSVTGLPPMAYLTRYRVELAAERLLHTDEQVNAIGESVGWADPNYFARRFKAHFGLSASAYRSRFAANSMRLGATGRPTI